MADMNKKRLEAGATNHMVRLPVPVDSPRETEVAKFSLSDVRLNITTHSDGSVSVEMVGTEVE